MKVYVTRTSGSYFKGDVREYADLKECIDILLETEQFGKFEPGVILYKARDIIPDYAKECEYEVELYDYWRE